MYKRIKLDNGLRMVCEKIPFVRSVSVGIWVGTGSRNETASNNGISHFIEHMLFKGTEKRSAKQIAESIDNIGGQLNAFTGKECTCYYTKTLDEHLETAVEVLADMFFNSRFADRDISVERKVILEEIGMYEDTPEELVHDVLSETVWSGDPLGYSILGTPKSLKKINRDRINEYIAENYLPSNSVIAVAGNFDEDGLIKIINQYFSFWKSDKPVKQGFERPAFNKGLRVREKETEQVHLCLGFDSIQHGDDRMYSLLALNNHFGGGMSSRLFQKIREKMGLAYSIYSYPSSYKKAGIFNIYAGMKPEQLEKVLQLLKKEIQKLVRRGISPEELTKSKEQLKGNYILGLESTGSRMNSIGKSELLLGYINTPEEVLDKIDRITGDSIDSVINQIFDVSRLGMAIVGSVRSEKELNGLFDLF